MSTGVPHPHPSRCSPLREDFDAIVRAHQDAVERGDATYRDPSTGLVVLTHQTHVDRGTCCDSGCRHCPYLVD